MTNTDTRLINRLNRLYRICAAGERGFETAAATISNRGLKVLTKSFAQQRAQFKVELQTEIERLGGRVNSRQSIPGMVHRGRIGIVATLIIGAEKVERYVLRESSLGEKVALRAYRKALAEALRPETKAMVERQQKQIQYVSEQIEQLRGLKEQQLVVRLFDSTQDTDSAVHALQHAGFDLSTMETIPLDNALDRYQGKGTTITDTVVSGAVGGAIWGSVFGALSGIGSLLVPNLDSTLRLTTVETWIPIIVASAIVGIVLGMILGFFIGTGISESDTYLYENSVEHGRLLVMMKTEAKRASQASQIMSQINTVSRAILQE